ncbi:MAG: hypothetical protein GX418_12225 [Clostridiales bacterium]|nr:hypothetical protein [Clostridiales bacterium]
MSRIDKAKAFRSRLNVAVSGMAQAGTIDADVVASVAEEFKLGGRYVKGELRSFDGKLYRCKKETTAAKKAPDKDAAGWELAGASETINGTVYPEWVKPANKKAGYKKGDVVACEGKVYESTEDGNTWKPDSGAGWLVKQA